jgi:hypothetical protein
MMSPTNSIPGPAYKVEELLALRGSASEPGFSLEKFPDEEVIKGSCSSLPLLVLNTSYDPTTLLCCTYYHAAA